MHDSNHAHLFSCRYTEYSVLTPDCPGCKHLIQNPSGMKESMQYVDDILSSECAHCKSRITARITGLYPNGISFKCSCFEPFKKQYQRRSIA